MSRRHAGSPWMSSWYRPSGMAAPSPSASSGASGRDANRSCTGRLVAAVTVSVNRPPPSSLPISSTPDLPRLLSESRRNATRADRADAGRLTLRSSSPGASAFCPSPVMKSATGSSRREPPGPRIVAVPSSPAHSEIMGPAGRDVHRLPPTVDMFQTLKDATKESQQGRIRSRPGQPRVPAPSSASDSGSAYSSATVQVAASSMPSAVTVTACQPAEPRSSRRRSGSGPKAVLP
jgi:hypothetical protein